MGDFYLLGDEDDEERKLRERFQMTAPEQSYGAALGGAGSYGAPSSDLDPRMVSSFLGQRAQDETRGAYPIPVREESNPLADNWFPLLATGLDLAVNKGRGLGHIAQGAMQGATARADRDAAMFEADRNAYLKQGEAGERAKAMQLGTRNADMRQQEIDLQAAQQRAVMERFLKGQEDPETAHARTAAEIRLSNARAAQAEADAGRDPNAITPYQQAQMDAMRDERTARNEDRDLDRADRAAGRQAALESAAAARDATAFGREQFAREKKNVADDKTTREFARDTETSRSMAHQIQELDPILEKYKGGDIPGTGKADRFVPNWAQDYIGGNSEDATRIDQLKTGVQAEYRHAKTGAAASVPEDLRLMIVNGTRPDSTEQEFRLGMEALKKALPLQIRAYGANREDQARAVLREQGLEDWVYGAKPPTAAAQDTLPADRVTGSTYRGQGPTIPRSQSTAPIIEPGASDVRNGNRSVTLNAPVPAGDVLQTQPGKPPKVDDYLRRLKDEDDDLGVIYR